MNCGGERANLFACAIVAAMMAFGCSGAVQEEGPAVVLRQPELPRTAERGSIEVPEATTRAMKACVEAMNHQSAEPSHAFQYNLGTNEEGKVLEVNLRDSTLREPSLEACFKRALAAMDVPKDALRVRRAKPFSGGESTYASRAEFGIVQAAAAPIAMLPIALVAGGVTILVGVTIHVISESLKERERCKKVKQSCVDDCSDDTLDDGFHEPMFSRCVRSCMEQANCR